MPYDAVATLVSTGDVPLDGVDYYYPGVSADAARDAVEFDLAVRGAE
ncbi:hypothetical protein [Actinokineospora bangkokensis]|nr:hypothetical protein [Actinokineospora bangkokensis]